MTRTITALADRLVGLVVPKAEAAAACDPNRCWDAFCYCRGPNIYYRIVCPTRDCGSTPGPCKNMGLGC